MGVDSNVLIFERIREEVRAGKAPSAAVDQGFAHAWVTIVDTHVTTIVSAAILFLFGTGPVKGFAATLTFGLLANLFHGGLRFAGHLRCPFEQVEARARWFPFSPVELPRQANLDRHRNNKNAGPAGFLSVPGSGENQWNCFTA